MKYTTLAVAALSLVLAGSLVFAQGLTGTPAQKAKTAHQQKVHRLTTTQKEALQVKAGIVMKAMQVKGDKRGVAKAAYSMKLQRYGTQQTGNK